MRQAIVGLGVALTIAAALNAAQGQRPPGQALADLTWPEAEKALTPGSVVVLPLGAGTVQHGLHLRLNTGERLARYLAGRVQASASVVMAPPLTYHFYPAFLEYPGSTSLSQDTARDMTVEIVRALAKYGPRRFYVLNTGAATMTPLRNAAEALANDGILMGYTDMRYHLDGARVTRRQTAVRGALHADEAITSMMLAIDPQAADMTKAVREYGAGNGVLTRQKDAPGRYSASGVVGDATLATKEQGQIYLEAVVEGAREDIESIRTARLPIARATTPATPSPAPRPQAPRPSEEKGPGGCTAGEERAIRLVGERFSYLWRQMDAEAIGGLFTIEGDMRHPDGTIERGPQVIYQNRLELFRKREYRGSVHPVQLNDIRCLPGGTAVADGKWELRFDAPPSPEALRRGLPPGKFHAGWCTLVLVRNDTAWAIQAWRYTVNPADGVPPPTTLKQPGFLGRGGGL
jgi:creatinine amidohydrolase